jgi:uncharacterized membrane protein YphA (DoxX/SURF4 family)
MENLFMQHYREAKENKWFRYFTILTRVALALGFLPSGFVKIMGERFTSLSVNHPMGAYLEALHHTGYYYTSIGVVQVLAAILLLIPRTATLGIILYFPIILNIAVLSHAVRFEGSLVTSPLMVLACIYLIVWDYDKFKFLLPWHYPKSSPAKNGPFPFRFLTFVLTIMVSVFFVSIYFYKIMPRNTGADCSKQCQNEPLACQAFCDCIHLEGRPLDQCLKLYSLQKEQ